MLKPYRNSNVDPPPALTTTVVATETVQIAMPILVGLLRIHLVGNVQHGDVIIDLSNALVVGDHVEDVGDGGGHPASTLVEKFTKPFWTGCKKRGETSSLHLLHIHSTYIVDLRGATSHLRNMRKSIKLAHLRN